FQAEDGIRGFHVTGVQTCALPICALEGNDTGITRLTESVKRSEERFRMLAEGVPNHLLFLDTDLRIEFANDVFLQAAGWSAEDEIGRASGRARARDAGGYGAADAA